MFKFSVDDSQFNSLELSVRQKLEKIVAEPAVLNEVGNTVVERIKLQVRAGRPLNATGRFPSLASSTVIRRAYLMKYNKAFPAAETSLSNLTLTGELMGSLGFDVTSPGELTVFFKGMHPKYSNEKGPYGKETENQKIVDYLIEKGFVPFDAQGIDKFQPLKNRITTIVKAALRRSLKLR